MTKNLKYFKIIKDSNLTKRKEANLKFEILRLCSWKKISCKTLNKFWFHKKMLKSRILIFLDTFQGKETSI